MRWLAIFVLVALLLAGCAAQERASISEMKYAKLFSVENKGSYTLVTDSEGRRIILYSAEKPEIEADLFIKIPVSRIIVLSTTHVSYLEAIDATDKIIGVPAINQWYFEDIERGIEDGTITVVGKARQPDYESILKLNPDVVFVDAKFVGEDVIKKFETLGIPYVACDSWLEKDPLGRLEWVKFFGAFIGKNREAMEYFENVENRIKQIEIAVKGLDNVRVVYALLLGGKVMVPGGQSYHAKLVEMAGGEYAFDDINSTRYSKISVEELIERASSADVYIAIYMGTQIKSKEDLIHQIPGLAKTKPFREGRVYAMEPWIWQQSHKLDVIVEDLARIFHPEKFNQSKLTMFRKLE